MTLTPDNATGNRRCFIALLPDAGSRERLQRCREAATDSNTGTSRGLRWVAPDALHLTLRFLGESSDAQVAYIEHMLPTLARGLPELAIHRGAIWPNRARPRLLVLELAAHVGLLELARECEALANQCGFAPEPRSFKAHLTLARLRPGCVPVALAQTPHALAFESLALMSSDPGTPGGGYRRLASIALNATAQI